MTAVSCSVPRGAAGHPIRRLVGSPTELPARRQGRHGGSGATRHDPRDRGQVAAAVSARRLRWLAGRAALGSAAHDRGRRRGAGGGANLGDGPGRCYALVHALDGRCVWDERGDRKPHLLCVRVEPASQRDLQAVARSAVHREGTRRRGTGLALHLYTILAWLMWNASISKVVAGAPETILDTVARQVRVPGLVQPRQGAQDRFARGRFRRLEKEIGATASTFTRYAVTPTKRTGPS